MAAEAYPKPALMLMPHTKFCPLCKQERPIEAFALDRRNKRDGHRWHCTKHQNPGPRPKLKYCPMCECHREETLFPVEGHDHHPAGKVQRRWYCTVNQELSPFYEEAHEVELQKRELFQLQREINETVEEQRRLLYSKEERTPEFRALLKEIKERLATLWNLLRRVRARVMADASDLQRIVCGEYLPDSVALYGKAKRPIDYGWQQAA